VQSKALNARQVVAGQGVLYLAGVAGGLRLYQKYPGFLGGVRAVLHATGHYQQLAGVKRGSMGMKLNVQLAFDHDKQLVFRRMIVPDKFAPHLSQLHVLVVKVSHYVRVPVVGKLPEFLFQVNNFHEVAQLKKM